MNERMQMLVSILEKVNEHPGFRDELVADAKTAIAREFDVAFPDELQIVVHENDPHTVHLSLPAKPQVLTEGELDQVVGGGWCGSCI